MHESFFGYNITRKYPYRWFTWIVVIGGITAAILLSVINLAANGYEPSVILSANPNETESSEGRRWFRKKPWSLAVKVSSTCQAQTLTVGEQFYTNNFGFSYTLARILKNGTEPSGSFTYHHDHLHACRINSIVIRPQTDQRGLNTFTVWASVNCTLYEDFNRTTIILKLSTGLASGYGVISVPAVGIPGMPALLALNRIKQPTLYWGQTMMNFTLNLLELRGGLDLDVYAYATGWLPDADRVRNSTDRTRYAEAGLDIHVASGLSRYEWGGLMGVPIDELITEDVWSSTFATDILSLRNTTIIPSNLTTEAVDTERINVLLFLSSVQALYFTILSDLGQTSSNNALMSPERTMAFCNKTIQMASQTAQAEHLADRPKYWLAPEPPPSDMDDFYRWARIAKPSVVPATLSRQYLCQVPKLKSTGSLVVGIMVADVVFMQLLWLVLGWVTTFLIERQNPEASYCGGCARTMGNPDGKESTHIDMDHSTGTATAVHPINATSTADGVAHDPVPMVTFRDSFTNDFSDNLSDPSFQTLTNTEYSDGRLIDAEFQAGLAHSRLRTTQI